MRYIFEGRKRLLDVLVVVAISRRPLCGGIKCLDAGEGRIADLSAVFPDRQAE